MTDRAPPSTASVAVATGILAALLGYFIGQGSSLGVFSSRPARKSWPNSYDVNVHADSSDEELMRGLRGEKGEEGSSEDEDEEEAERDSEGDGSLSAFKGYAGECKLVLVVRTDLGMTKGNRSNPPCPKTPTTNDPPPPSRKNGSPMLPRHPLQLQISLRHPILRSPPAPLGIHRPGQSSPASRQRRRARGAASARGGAGAMCARCHGCGQDADRGGECDGLWDWAGAEEGGG